MHKLHIQSSWLHIPINSSENKQTKNIWFSLVKYRSLLTSFWNLKHNSTQMVWPSWSYLLAQIHQHNCHSPEWLLFLSSTGSPYASTFHGFGPSSSPKLHHHTMTLIQHFAISHQLVLNWLPKASDHLTAPLEHFWHLTSSPGRCFS